MTTRRLTPAAFATLAISLALGVRAASADCPANTINIIAPDIYYISAADESVLGRVADFDARAGTIHIFYPGGNGFMSTTVSDLFHVTGVPDGTPLTVTAVLDVNGYSKTGGCGGTGCHGIFTAQLGQGSTVSSRSADAGFTLEADLIGTVAFGPLSVIAGQDFPLQYQLSFARSPGGDYSGGGTCQLRFVGLPPGAHVVSCWGLDSVTPTVAASWGALKIRYR